MSAAAETNFNFHHFSIEKYNYMDIFFQKNNDQGNTLLKFGSKSEFFLIQPWTFRQDAAWTCLQSANAFNILTS